MIIKGIYFGDLLFLLLNLLFCLYLVIRYVSRNKESKFIYYFFSFAITLSVCRITQLSLTILISDNCLKWESIEESASLNVCSILSAVCNFCIFIFGYTLVYSVYRILQRMLLLLDEKSHYKCKMRGFFIICIIDVVIFTANNVMLFLPLIFETQLLNYYGAWTVNSLSYGTLAIMYLMVYCSLVSHMNNFAKG